MLDMYFLEPLIEEIFTTYQKKWFNTDGDFSWEDVVSDLPALAEELTALYEDAADAYSMLDNYTSSSDRTSAESGITTASQDSVDELNGRATAIQGHTFIIAEKITNIAEYLENFALSALTPTNNIVVDGVSSDSNSGAILSEVCTIGEDIQRMRDNSAQILEVVTGIKNDTTHLSRLETIENSMGTMGESIRSMKKSLSSIDKNTKKL